MRRGAREAEGAPLLREYRVKSLIEGSNPSLSASFARRAPGALFSFDGLVPAQPSPRASRGKPVSLFPPLAVARCGRHIHVPRLYAGMAWR